MILSKQLMSLLLAITLGLSVGLTGCGGSSDDPAKISGTNNGGDPNPDPDPDPNPNPDPDPEPEPEPDPGFTGVEGPLDPVQTQLSSVVGDQIGGALPDPLGSTVQCTDTAVQSFVDAPDALLAAFAALPGGADPAEAFNGAAGDMSAAMQDFGAKLQAALMILAGQTASCDGSSAGGNPFAGTPLEPLGAPLGAFISGSSAVGDGGNGGDPDLTVVVATIVPLMDQLNAAFGSVPAEVYTVPVLGGLLITVQDLLTDMSAVLTSAGAYDPVATQADIETMLGNALTNALLGVLPIGDIDAATGQDFTTPIQDGINTVTGEFGGTLGMVITPAFNDALDGAAAPILDPVEGLTAQLLDTNDSGTMTGNPLDGLLAAQAGDGLPDLDGFLALITGGAGNTTVTDVASDLPGAGTGTPLDDLLILVDPANAGDLDDVLGALSILLGGGPLGGLLDDVLGGLL